MGKLKGNCKIAIASSQNSKSGDFKSVNRNSVGTHSKLETTNYTMHCKSASNHNFLPTYKTTELYLYNSLCMLCYAMLKSHQAQNTNQHN